MLSIRIACIGKSRSAFLKEGEAQYLKRLTGMAKVSVEELRSFPDLPERETKKRESSEILSRSKSNEYLIALDEHGKEFTSRQFAEFFETRTNQGTSQFVFAIGGPYGHDAALLQSAKLTFALSKMTFTYEMTRLILLEQMYRALSIMRGTSYHKE